MFKNVYFALKEQVKYVFWNQSYFSLECSRYCSIVFYHQFYQKEGKWQSDSYSFIDKLGFVIFGSSGSHQDCPSNARTPKLFGIFFHLLLLCSLPSGTPMKQFGDFQINSPCLNFSVMSSLGLYVPKCLSSSLQICLTSDHSDIQPTY